MLRAAQELNSQLDFQTQRESVRRTDIGELDTALAFLDFVGSRFGGTARSLKYTSLVLPGDMTGDGVGDLHSDHKVDVVAIDAAGTMWRFSGKGARAFTNRHVRIGGGWQRRNLILIAR